MSDTKQSPAKEMKTEQQEAKELAAELKADQLWKNSRGEWFTNENYALLSEGGNAAKIKKFDFAREHPTGNAGKESGAE